MKADPTVKSEVNQHINIFINNALNDMKNLTNALKPISKQASQTNNALINKMLLVQERNSLELIKQYLGHIVRVVELKGMYAILLSILTKIIAFIKTVNESQSKSYKQFQSVYYKTQMCAILNHTIDIIFLLKNKYRDPQMSLRIIQTTYSLIDNTLLQFSNFNQLTRLYSICFDCCMSTAIIQNISVSALFSLTQIVFESIQTQISIELLTHFLEFVLQNKRFAWLKEQQLGGMIWDLIIIAIKYFPSEQVRSLGKNNKVSVLLNLMYSRSIEKAFSQNDNSLVTEQDKSIRSIENERSLTINFKKGSLPNFIRFYKSFIYLSLHLSLKVRHQHIQVVNFVEHLMQFNIVYDLQRSHKLYILLEGVSLLLIQGNNMLVEQERGYVLLDVFCKIAQQICLQGFPIEMNWEGGELFLEKMCGDYAKFTDNDFAKLTKNTIIRLRKKFETEISSALSLENESSENPQVKHIKTKRWQRTIKTVIRIIRYLSSLKFKEGTNDQIVRKLLTQLQYWFIICPSNKSQNLVLHQLMSTSSLLDTQMQAIKVSQCLQIGTNIIYAYYDALDNVGLSILIKLMASVNTSWEDGKGFDQLEQVCIMSQKLYHQQRLVASPESFKKTIQAFVQCANSLLADMQQPQKHQQKAKKLHKNHIERYSKMLQYIFKKMTLILQQNVKYIPTDWDFITGFWISFCSSKNKQIRAKTMNHVFELITFLLKTKQFQPQKLLSSYSQLAKLNKSDISITVISQLKQLLPSITAEQPIIQIFKVLKIIIENKNNNSYTNQIYQLEELLIKQSIFEVKSTQNIILVIEAIRFISNDKNQQYKTISLLWNISDHIKSLILSKQIKEAQSVMQRLFMRIFELACVSNHPQTKQTCIHTFTQIIAEQLVLLDAVIVHKIMKDQYLELFSLLMGFHNGVHVQLIRFAIKNIIKIIKKCFAYKIPETQYLLVLIVQKIIQQLEIKGKQLTIQYMFQLCTILQYFREVHQGDEQIDKQKCKQNTCKLLRQMQKLNISYDQSSLIWKRKYEPSFIELKKYFENN